MRNLKKILSIMFCLVFVVCLFASFAGAAGESWTAVKPSYNTFVNGQQVSGMEVMNIDGRTYIQPTALEQFGILRSWDETNNRADFYIPQPVSNQGSTNSISDLTKAGIKFYKGNGQFLGNGVYVSEDTILTTINVYSPSFILKAKDYKNNNVNLDPQPIKIGSRLVLLKTTGAKSSNVAKLATERPETGDEIILVGSLSEVPNMVNFSTVKDYFDFNWLTIGDKEYMRTYNNQNQSCQGSGMYNSDGELSGIFIYSGANYSLSVTLDDIVSFLE